MLGVINRTRGLLFLSVLCCVIIPTCNCVSVPEFVVRLFVLLTLCAKDCVLGEGTDLYKQFWIDKKCYINHWQRMSLGMVWNVPCNHMVSMVVWFYRNHVDKMNHAYSIWKQWKTGKDTLWMCYVIRLCEDKKCYVRVLFSFVLSNVC